MQAAAASHKPIAIQGGNSKAFYGRATAGTTVSVSEHRGILDYTPSELVISARAGTPLTEIESVLAQEEQMLPFEPPHFAASATLGGSVACGLSGPRRPYAGAVRDVVLGVNCINGKGEVLRLGGQVMKNVAGYDLSRTLTGSLGTLALLLDVHLRVLPRPALETTLVQHCSATTAVEYFNRWAGQPLPLSGACYLDDRLYVRLSGMPEGVQAAAAAIGGEPLDNAERISGNNCANSNYRSLRVIRRYGGCRCRQQHPHWHSTGKPCSTGAAHSAGSGANCLPTPSAVPLLPPAVTPPCFVAATAAAPYSSHCSRRYWHCTSA